MDEFDPNFVPNELESQSRRNSAVDRMGTIAGKEGDAVVDGCVRPAMRDATGLSESIHNHNREKRIKLVWQWEPMKYGIPR